jgi:hypothetical protein
VRFVAARAALKVEWMVVAVERLDSNNKSALAALVMLESCNWCKTSFGVLTLLGKCRVKAIVLDVSEDGPHIGQQRRV